MQRQRRQGGLHAVHVRHLRRLRPGRAGRAHAARQLPAGAILPLPCRRAIFPLPTQQQTRRKASRGLVGQLRGALLARPACSVPATVFVNDGEGRGAARVRDGVMGRARAGRCRGAPSARARARRPCPAARAAATGACASPSASRCACRRARPGGAASEAPACPCIRRHGACLAARGCSRQGGRQWACRNAAT